MAETQASMVVMKSSNLNKKQLLEERASSLELKLGAEDNKTKEALNGQSQAETALVQVQASLVDTERHHTEEKQGLEDRLFRKEQGSKLAHRAYFQDA